ncbi:MAG: right-handed parallel beta-helix repeat-containing protein [Bacteroidales bacterium]|nr:right-handed parallel beta-helix repeat-containing protein [Bacteroidales bacterium]
MKNFLVKLLILGFVLNFHFSFSATFSVTNTFDSGSGSLREAIDYANAMSGTHSIVFNIPVSDAGFDSEKGIWTINLLSPLSYIIRSNVTIDGSSQAVNQGDTNPLGPEIAIDGNNNEVDYCFSIINASGIVIKGLCIKEFVIGIQVFGSSAINNHIYGNYVGITADGEVLAGNNIGIEIIGGASQNLIGGSEIIYRNIVSGNEHIGIRIVNANNNQVKGNYVGVNAMGNLAMPNYDGISIEGTASNNLIGGSENGSGNLVSGNYAYGIPVFGAGCNNNEIYGNLIGTDCSGTISIPNTYGVLFDDGADSNILGGTNEGERNILSGNSGYGVFIYNMGTRNNIVKGNYIGSDISGNNELPNANGIVIDGAAYNSVIEENLISGNLQHGIIIHITGCDSNYIANNLIGTKIDGMSPLGNGVDGIRIAEGPKNNIIEKNTIAFNAGNGVSILNDNDIQNKISQNAFFLNGSLAIELFPSGVNLNDENDIDEGPNMGLNFPVINDIQVVITNVQHEISGMLDTENPESCYIELYLASVDETGHGEGAAYLETIIPDASGNWNTVLTGIYDDDYITAITIDNEGNTSEFSACVNSFGGLEIENLNSLSKFAIFPNPTTDCLFIEVDNDKDIEFELVDNFGSIVMKSTINTNIFEIYLGFLKSGIYTILFYSNKQLLERKNIILVR